MWSAFVAAVRFLTRIPLSGPADVAERDQATSALFYPLVGLLLGLALWAGALALGTTAPAVAAAVLVSAWTWGTGGLHLDGLADSADAWVGGIGNRERSLEIMKDPAIGPIGAAALVLALIAKWAALSSLIGAAAAVLPWLPALARTQLLLVFLTTPYAGRGGLGALLVKVSRLQAWIVAGLIWGACLLMLGAGGWVLALTAGATFALWRRAMMKRLGGFTGDTAGALVELTEAAGLLAFAIYSAP